MITDWPQLNLLILLKSTPDDARLRQLGYKQQLHRRLSYFHNFVLMVNVFGCIGNIPGMFSLSWKYGGPVTLVVGWPVVSLGAYMCTLSIAELASAYPTCGGLHYITYQLADERSRSFLSWMTAFLNFTGRIVLVGSSNYTVPVVLLPIIEKFTPLNANNKGNYIAFLLVTALQEVMIAWVPNKVPGMLEASLYIQIVGWIVFVAVLPAVAPKPRDMNYLFDTMLYDEKSKMSKTVTTMLGLTSAAWVMMGQACGLDLAEETMGAELGVPLGMLLAASTAGVLGWLLIFALCISVQNPAAINTSQNPVADIVYDVFIDRFNKPEWASVFLATLPISAFFCGLSTLFCSSRMTFAMARDGILPFSHLWSRLQPVTAAPNMAVRLVSILSIMVMMPAAWHTEYFDIMARLAVVIVLMSYLVPIVLRMWKGSKTFKPGVFKLGRLAPLVHFVALVFCVCSAVSTVAPSIAKGQADLVLLIACGLVGTMILVWVFYARYHFHGPVITVPHEEAGELPAEDEDTTAAAEQLLRQLNQNLVVYPDGRMSIQDDIKRLVPMNPRASVLLLNSLLPDQPQVTGRNSRVPSMKLTNKDDKLARHLLMWLQDAKKISEQEPEGHISSMRQTKSMVEYSRTVSANEESEDPSSALPDSPLALFRRQGSRRARAASDSVALELQMALGGSGHSAVQHLPSHSPQSKDASELELRQSFIKELQRASPNSGQVGEVALTPFTSSAQAAMDAKQSDPECNESGSAQGQDADTSEYSRLLKRKVTFSSNADIPADECSVTDSGGSKLNIAPSLTARLSNLLMGTINSFKKSAGFLGTEDTELARRSENNDAITPKTEHMTDRTNSTHAPIIPQPLSHALSDAEQPLLGVGSSVESTGSIRADRAPAIVLERRSSADKGGPSGFFDRRSSTDRSRLSVDHLGTITERSMPTANDVSRMSSLSNWMDEVFTAEERASTTRKSGDTLSDSVVQSIRAISVEESVTMGTGRSRRPSFMQVDHLSELLDNKHTLQHNVLNAEQGADGHAKIPQAKKLQVDNQDELSLPNVASTAKIAGSNLQNMALQAFCDDGNREAIGEDMPASSNQTPDGVVRPSMLSKDMYRNRRQSWLLFDMAHVQQAAS